MHGNGKHQAYTNLYENRHTTFFHNLSFAILECSQHNNVYTILITVQRDATKSSLFIIEQVHSTCFGCQPYPSSGVHKTVTTASGTAQVPPSNVAKLAWPRLYYINNCPTRCNTKQSIYYSASSLYMFRMSTIPIIRST